MFHLGKFSKQLGIVVGNYENENPKTRLKVEFCALIATRNSNKTKVKEEKKLEGNTNGSLENTENMLKTLSAYIKNKEEENLDIRYVLKTYKYVLRPQQSGKETFFKFDYKRKYKNSIASATSNWIHE